MEMLITVIEQGLVYGIMALGVYITYKILDFPDLTVDGSFPLGAAVTAVLLGKGVNPYLCLIAAFAAGVVAGICTGVIHVHLKVRDLLSGIIMMTALWSINLYIAGTSNVPLFSYETIFRNRFLEHSGLQLFPYIKLAIIVTVVLICKILLDLYLKTKSGFLLRAVGDNPAIVTTLAKDQGMVKIQGLALANGFAALAGSMFAQEQRVFEISMGTGAIVVGLASVIIGTTVLGNLKFMKATTAVLIGSVVYKGCVAVAIMQFEPQSMKLITAVLFLAILVVSQDRKKKVKSC